MAVVPLALVSLAVLPLVSLRLFVVLSGIAIAVYGAWVFGELVRWRHDRRLLPTVAGWRLWTLRSSALLLGLTFTVAVILDGVNRHYAYFPTWAALFGDISPDLTARPLTPAQLAPRPSSVPIPTHGVVEKVEIAGLSSGVPTRPAYVYLPPAYFDGSQPTRRFPVLYLLHGSPGTYQDWLRGGYVDRTMDALLAKKQIQPFIVVLPDANGGYARDLECQDVVRGPQDQTYLVKDVVAFVDHRYRTARDRLGRAVGGLSTGGYCGLNFTFRHPDVFSAAVLHSGTGHPDQNFYTGNLFGGNRHLFVANSPDVYLPTITITSPTGVYMDDGADDAEALRASRRLYNMLQARGVSVDWYVVQHEGHTFVAFRKNLLLSLRWVSTWFVSHRMISGSAQVGSPDDSYLPPPLGSDRGPTPGQPAFRRPPGTPRRAPTTTAAPPPHPLLLPPPPSTTVPPPPPTSTTAPPASTTTVTTAPAL